MNDNTNTNTNTNNAPVFIIEDFKEPVKENPYNAHVTALINAGADKQITVIVPLADKLKARTLFASAANEQERTARVRMSEAHNDGWRYVFTLTALNKPRRNKAREDKAREESAGHAYVPTNGDKPVCATCANSERFHVKSDNPAEQQEPEQEQEQEPVSAPVPAPKPRNARTRKA